MGPSYPSTRYANVDLDVWSRRSLQPLVAPMGSRVSVLYIGRERKRHGAHLELRGCGFAMSADAAILGLVGVIESLPPSAWKLWDTASTREFNIGIEVGLQPHGFEVHLKPETVSAVTDIGATVAVTVYAPQVDEDGRPLPADRVPPGARVPPVGGRAASRRQALVKGRRTSRSSGRRRVFVRDTEKEWEASTYVQNDAAPPLIASGFFDRWVESPALLVRLPFLLDAPSHIASARCRAFPFRHGRQRLWAAMSSGSDVPHESSRPSSRTRVARRRELQTPRIETLPTQHPMKARGSERLNGCPSLRESVGLSPGLRVAELPLKQSAGAADFLTERRGILRSQQPAAA